MLSVPASLRIVAALTVGVVAEEPSTLWSREFENAFRKRLRFAFVPAALRIVPPLSVRAVGPTPIPFESESAVCTT